MAPECSARVIPGTPEEPRQGDRKEARNAETIRRLRLAGGAERRRERRRRCDAGSAGESRSNPVQKEPDRESGVRA